MTEPIPEVASAVQNNLGWLAALATGSWAWVLRMIVGRHMKGLDEMRTTLTKMDGRLKFIEGRFKQQDIDAIGGE